MPIHTYLTFTSTLFMLCWHIPAKVLEQFYHRQDRQVTETSLISTYTTLRIRTRAQLQTILLKTLGKAHKNVITTRSLGSQPLTLKLITLVGKLAMHCLKLYKLKEAWSLIHIIKQYASATFITFKHLSFAYILSIISHVLTALYKHPKQVYQDINKLMQAYKQGNYYILGKACAYTLQTLVGRTLAHKILRTSLKIARQHNKISRQYTKTLLCGIKHSLYPQDTRELLTK